MKTFLFFDLEDTLVSPTSTFDFSDCVILWRNIDLFKDLLNTEINGFSGSFTDHFDHINIFSFAIHNSKDKENFEKWLKADIEKVFNLPIRFCPTVEDVQRVVSKSTRLCFDNVHEFMQLWGKERGFLDWAKALKLENSRLILFDDVVDDVEMKFVSSGTSVRLFRIPSNNDSVL